MVTKQEYLLAQQTVVQYHREQEDAARAKFEAIKVELDAYFKGTYIKKYRLGEIRVTDYHELPQITIIPVKPDFDEDYGDDKMDRDITAIGLKHGVDLGWTSDIYGK